MSHFVPDLYYQNISKIPLSDLKNRGICAIICDLDNTLDSHQTKTPSKSALAFLNAAKEKGFALCIISNGKHERVARYLEGLSLPYIAKAGKPLKKSYEKALALLDINPAQVAFIGDQIFTDTWGANRVGLTTILVEPIESIENPFFFPKRALEKLIKANLAKE